MPLSEPFSVISPSEIATGDRFKLEQACRAQVQPVYLGDHRALCRILGRYKFYVDTRDEGFGSNILLDGFWEMWLTIAMTRHVKPGMVAIDIGANYGYYSVLLADLVGPEGKLIAVEPNPSTASSLRKSIALNGLGSRTTILEAAAASSSSGTALLYAPINEPKNAMIIPAAFPIDDSKASIRSVPRWHLDAELEKLAKVDFIKIDAEGAEEAILKGMQGILQRDRPNIVLEYNAARYDQNSTMLTDLIALYKQFYYIDFYGGTTLTNSNEVKTTNFGEDWLLFFQRPE